MHLSDLTTAARLFADPTRGAMLRYLLDGRARPAGELTRAAGVSAQTASAHLAQLLNHRVLAVLRPPRGIDHHCNHCRNRHVN